MINGAPTDNNAKLFKEGAHSVIDPSGCKVAKEYDTPDWSPDKAQQEMEQAITALGKDEFVGRLLRQRRHGRRRDRRDEGRRGRPDDDPDHRAGRRARRDPADPLGEQYMTIYKAIKPEAEARRELAVALAREDARRAAQRQDRQRHERRSVDPADPIAVTKDNINDTIVKDGFWTADQICTGKYAAACKAAGIQ